MEGRRHATQNVGATPVVLGDLSVVVARALETVVVTVTGTVDVAGRELLETVLEDLIDGQGNLHVAVDLGKADVDGEAVNLLGTAARRSRSVGGTFTVKAPPAAVLGALRADELDGLIEVLPRRA
jgi:anti-anti-sigma regulatory factor